MADALLLENEYSSKNVEKVTDELAFMKQKVNTIHRKGLDQFESQSFGSKGWIKLDVEFLETTFLIVIQNSIKHCFKIILKINT